MNWKHITLAIACAFAVCIALAGCNLPTSRITQPTPAEATSSAPLAAPTLPVTVIPIQEPTAEPTQAPTSPPGEASVPTGALTPSRSPAGSATQPPAIPTTPTAPLPMPSATPTAGSSSYTPFHATVTVDEIKLRTGPGYLFPALNLLPKGTVLSVYGRSAGDEWIYVETAKAPSAGFLPSCSHPIKI